MPKIVREASNTNGRLKFRLFLRRWTAVILDVDSGHRWKAVA
jgi:hypothetical protein